MDDHDDLRRLFGPVTPLDPPPGTFDRITRTARRRRRIRTLTTVTTATTAVLALAAGGVIAHQQFHGSGDRRPAVNAAGSTSGSPAPGTTPRRDGVEATQHGAPAQDASSTPSPTPASAPSPTPASTPTCSNAQLRVSTGDQSAGQNEIGVVIRFQNVSSASCALIGYPGVELVDPGEAGVDATRSGFRLWSDPGATAVTLAPGGYASAGMEADEPTTDAAAECPSYSSAEVMAPNHWTSMSLNLSAQITVCPSAGVRVTSLTAGGAGPPVR